MKITNDDKGRRDFDNYQRILAGHPVTSLTILTLTLTFTASAFGGIFAISKSSFDPVWKCFWLVALGCLIVLITAVLFVVWLREHKKAKQAIEDLRSADVQFPDTPGWTGVIFGMLFTFHVVALVFWLVFIAVTISIGIGFISDYAAPMIR